MKFIKKSPKTITKTKCSIPNKFTIHTSYKPENWNVCLIPKFCNSERNIKKARTNPKEPFQIIDKPTDETNQLIDSNKKEIVQQRNNILPYVPKEHNLREITQLYSFTGLKVVPVNPDNNQKQTIHANCLTQLL